MSVLGAGVGCQYSIRICRAHSPSRSCAWWTARGTDTRPPVSVDPVRDRQMLPSLGPEVTHTMHA